MRERERERERETYMQKESERERAREREREREREMYTYIYIYTYICVCRAAARAATVEFLKGHHTTELTMYHGNRAHFRFFFFAARVARCSAHTHRRHRVKSAHMCVGRKNLGSRGASVGCFARRARACGGSGVGGECGRVGGGRWRKCGGDEILSEM